MISAASEQLRDRLEQLRAEFMQASGGKTVCEIGKQHSVEYSLKKSEGKMQALTDIVRCLKKEPQAELENCVSKVYEAWRRLSEISPAWLAYKQAGIEEIEQALQLLDLDRQLQNIDNDS